MKSSVLAMSVSLPSGGPRTDEGKEWPPHPLPAQIAVLVSDHASPALSDS